MSHSDVSLGAKAKRIRIGTYNIHFFKNAAFETNTLQVAETIVKSGVDVIGLQEVTRNGEKDESGEFLRYIDVLKMRTGLKYGVVGGSHICNALLSRFPIVSEAVHTLKSHHHSEKYHRVLVDGVIEIPSRRMEVMVTHLDHLDENIRLGQIDYVFKDILKGISRPHLLIGDFNALKKEDYCADSLEKITAHRRESGWEAPCFQLIEKLEREGYSDCLVCECECEYKVKVEKLKLSSCSGLIHGHGHGGSSSTVQGQTRSFDKGKAKSKMDASASAEMTMTPIATCWAGTRIDYIFASGLLMQDFTVVDRGICKSVGSDHSLVWIDFEY